LLVPKLVPPVRQHSVLVNSQICRVQFVLVPTISQSSELTQAEFVGHNDGGLAAIVQNRKDFSAK
jgi:hypothetical protein